MRFKAALVVCALACCPVMGIAQMNMGGEKVAVGVAMSPAKAQDAMLSMFEEEMMGVVNAMPADKFDFAPMSSAIAGAKFDGVRTFAGQAKHVAQANFYFFSTFGGPKPTTDVKGIGDLKSKDEIVAALKASFTYAHQAIGGITAANAYQGIEGADGLHTRATVASFAVAHGYDHYGQMVEYLRMNGIVPPGSK